MSALIERLAQALCSNGVSRIFGVPGSGLSLELITALERHGVGFVGASHEASAALMAGGFARASGTLGCAISIKGPGLANQLPGIAANHFENLPVLSISEAYAASDASGRMHKRLDHAAMLKPVVRGYASAANAGPLVARLADIAREEVPGPVHLDLHNDLSSPELLLQTPPKARLRDDEFAKFVSRLASSRRPAVIVGSLAIRREWGVALRALRVPVFTTVSAKGFVPEQDGWAAGIFTGDGGAFSPEQRILGEADLVIGFGLRATEVLTPRVPTVELLLVDEITPDWPMAAATQRMGSASSTQLQELIAVLHEHEWGSELVSNAIREMRERLLAPAWLPAAAVAVLEEALPDDTAVVVDTGLFCTIAEHVWRASPSKPFWGSANGRYMGTALSTAIGVSFARTPRPTLCIVGDGGVRSHLADLAIAVHQRLPLIVVFMADGRYSSIAIARRAGLSEAPTIMPRRSWYAIAEAVGCRAFEVSSAEELTLALQDWSSTPLFIEAVFEPEIYSKMTAQLR